MVVDGVDSVDGAIAPLAELYAVCRERDAVLFVDDAHGLGVRGPGGSGTLAEAGLAGAPDVVLTATLSKSLGSQGGVVLGARAVTEHLVDAARPFIFDTGLAPAAVGAALAALEIVRAEPERVAALHAAAASVAASARAAAPGVDVPAPTAAMVPVVLGDPVVALTAAAACAEHGLRAGCFRPPSVPPGTSRLRLTARADLTADDLALVDQVLHKVLGPVARRARRADDDPDRPHRETTERRSTRHAPWLARYPLGRAPAAEGGRVTAPLRARPDLDVPASRHTLNVADAVDQGRRGTASWVERELAHGSKVFYKGWLPDGRRPDQHWLTGPAGPRGARDALVSGQMEFLDIPTASSAPAAPRTA